MSKVLFIKGNPKISQDSKSLALGEEFLKEYKKLQPEDEIVVIDLYNDSIVEIDNDLLSGFENLINGVSFEELDKDVLEKITKYSGIADQFMEADKYIFATPLWNLALPAKVKTYIDAVCVAGKTFKYTEKGPVGLLENKKCVHLHASGGFHSEDSCCHGDSYLKDIMSFMGIKDYKSIVIEGHSAIPDRAETIVQEAHSKIPEVANWLV